MNIASEIHAHEVMEMLAQSGQSYTRGALLEAIHVKFGKEARFHTCCKEGLSANDIIQLFIAKGKIVGNDDAMEFVGAATCGGHHH